MSNPDTAVVTIPPRLLRWFEPASGKVLSAPTWSEKGAAAKALAWNAVRSIRAMI